jgi:RimJ/RimL family protein N-acetyltransferase
MLRNMPETPILEGQHIRLVPLSMDHLPELVQIGLDPATKPIIWRHMVTWPTTSDDLREWIKTALTAAASGTAMPWTTILKGADTAPDRVIGSTRFADIDLRHKNLELGSTWIAPAFHGTRANTEAKLLQLTYAFEVLGVNRVAFKTHHENLRSQAAIKAIGGVYEGTFRHHYIMPDGSRRDSCWFSIIRPDWPEVQDLLRRRINAPA